MNKRVWVLAGAIAVIAIGIGVYFAIPKTDPTKEIRATVVDFGAQLKEVDALAPNATSSIATRFAPYVAPELLSVWVDEPTLAPVRFGKEPWPQRIEIQSIDKQKDKSYWVTAFIIEMENSGDYINNKVTIVFEKKDKKWYITDFSGYPTKEHKPVNTGALTDPKYLIPG